jgi:hypothetical protein
VVSLSYAASFVEDRDVCTVACYDRVVNYLPFSEIPGFKIRDLFSCQFHDFSQSFQVKAGTASQILS